MDNKPRQRKEITTECKTKGKRKKNTKHENTNKNKVENVTKWREFKSGEVANPPLLPHFFQIPNLFEVQGEW